MAKGKRNQRMVTNPPKRLPNQQDSYEKAPVKATTPGIKKKRISVDYKPSASDRRRHADGKNHKNANKVRPVQSTLRNEPKVGDKQYPTKAHLAKGVPKTEAMRQGYYPPGAKKKRGVGGSTEDGHSAYT